MAEPGPDRSQRTTDYEVRMLTVLTLVKLAEKKIVASIASAGNRSRLKTARSDVRQARAMLGFARKQMAGFRPPAGLARMHRDMQEAIARLIAGCADIERGIGYLEAGRGSDGSRWLRKGSAEIAQAMQLIRRHSKGR